MNLPSTSASIHLTSAFSTPCPLLTRVDPPATGEYVWVSGTDNGNDSLVKHLVQRYSQLCAQLARNVEEVGLLNFEVLRLRGGLECRLANLADSLATAEATAVAAEAAEGSVRTNTRVPWVQRLATGKASLLRAEIMRLRLILEDACTRRVAEPVT